MQSTPDTQANPPTAQDRVALLYCTDLMFGVRLQRISRDAGLVPVTVKPGAPLPGGEVLVVDLGARGDWRGAIREARSKGIVVVAFGPHLDVDVRRLAKEAGASRVLANSNLLRDLPGILSGLLDSAKVESGMELTDHARDQIDDQ